MDANDGLLRSGAMAPCEHVGEAPVVGVWIKRGDGHALVFGGDSDEIAVDVAGILAQRRDWDPQIEVVGERGQGPEAERSGESPTVAIPWLYVRATADGRSVYGPPENETKVDRLLIRLPGLPTGQRLQAAIAVTLTAGGQRHSLSLPIDLSPEPPAITAFRARPSIVVTGDDVVFTVECERVSSWTITDQADAPLAKSRPGLNPQAPVKERTGPQRMGPSGPRFRRYRLTATNSGPAHSSADVVVKVQDSAGWVAPPRWWSEGQVAGLWVNPGREVIYALVRTKQSASVWWSADGFGRWEQVTVAPKEMVTSAPGVCLSLESGTKLVFAGGSTVDATRPSRTVWIFDVTTRTWSAPREALWKARTGHACVVAVDGRGVETLWLIGGVDANGNALNEIWASPDGTTWERRATPEWAARCMFGATVQGSKIWVGGGFEEPDGKAVNDIWSWDAKSGVGERAGLSPTEGDWDLGAFALSSLDATMYVAGMERKVGPAGTVYRTMFGPLASDNAGLLRVARVAEETWSERAESSRLEMVAFNGCLWLFTQRSMGEGVIETQGLHYFVPSRAGSAV